MSKARCLSLDIITTLPETIIETILCLSPIQEAARTSILSRDWRYKWTKIPNLVFCKFTVPERTLKNTQTYDITNARKNMDRICKLFYAIIKFCYCIRLQYRSSHFPWMQIAIALKLIKYYFHLSRNHTVKKLTLHFDNIHLYKLPSCFFSFHNLTDLHLYGCVLDRQLIFTGFGSLRSLYLNNVVIPAKSLLHLLSNCPSLKNLSLLLREDNLGDELCTVIELFDCLHVVEHLTSWAYIFGILCDCDETPPDVLKEYPDVWLEHLDELEIEYFSKLEREMEFVKFILARSPNLKKVKLFGLVETHEEELEMLQILLWAPHTSPAPVDFILGRQLES